MLLESQSEGLALLWDQKELQDLLDDITSTDEYDEMKEKIYHLLDDYRNNPEALKHIHDKAFAIGTDIHLPY